MRSVAKASPTHCDMLPNELDTEIPAKPRHSISRASSSVARRSPGLAISARAGKAAGIGDPPFGERLAAIIACGGQDGQSLTLAMTLGLDPRRRARLYRCRL